MYSPTPVTVAPAGESVRHERKKVKASNPVSIHDTYTVASARCRMRSATDWWTSVRWPFSKTRCVEGVPPERDAAGHEPDERDREHRRPGDERGHTELGGEQLHSSHRPHEHETQVAPRRVARHRVAAEDRHDDDQQEHAHRRERGGRHHEAGEPCGEEEQPPAALTRVWAGSASAQSS